MRKRLVALLSLAGLASSSTSAVSQALKGSSPTPGTKTESQVKGDKVNQENAAAQDDSSKKMRKAGGEQQANKDVVTEKVGADQIVHKHIAGVKYEKKTTENNAGKTEATVKLTNADAASKDAAKTKIQPEYTRYKKNQPNVDGASKDAAKVTKARTENTAIQDSQIKKVKTVTGETDAVKNDAGRKHRKASNDRQDALTVKQKIGEDAGAGKAKLEKNAAESSAVQQDANKKLQKQTDKASPK